MSAISFIPPAARVFSLRARMLIGAFSTDSSRRVAASAIAGGQPRQSYRRPDAHGGSQDFGVRAALIVVRTSAPIFGAVDGCNAPAIDANWFDSDHALPLSRLRSRCSI